MVKLALFTVRGYVPKIMSLFIVTGTVFDDIITFAVI